jgi:hypothetical protein
LIGYTTKRDTTRAQARPGPWQGTRTGDGRPVRRRGERCECALQIRDVPRAFRQALLEVPCLRLSKGAGVAELACGSAATLAQ